MSDETIRRVLGVLERSLQAANALERLIEDCEALTPDEEITQPMRHAVVACDLLRAEIINKIRRDFREKGGRDVSTH